MNQAESLEIREQMEEDSDLEFQMMQQNYEKRLCSEKETYLILKGESGIMKKQVRIWYPQGRVGHHEETGEDLVPSREEGPWGESDSCKSQDAILVSSGFY